MGWKDEAASLGCHRKWARKRAETLGSISLIVRCIRYDIHGTKYRVCCCQVVKASPGFESVEELVRECSMLAHLNLCGHGIGPIGAEKLAGALQKCTQLSVLVLARNDLGAEGARSLTEVLRQNTALTHLEVGDNNLGAEGVRCFASALSSCTSLRCGSLSRVRARAVQCLVLKQRVAATWNWVSTAVEPKACEVWYMLRRTYETISSADAADDALRRACSGTAIRFLIST